MSLGELVLIKALLDYGGGGGGGNMWLDMDRCSELVSSAAGVWWGGRHGML